MNATERASISETIQSIFDWIRHRKPGPATLDWIVADPSGPLVLDLSFPSMTLTDEEDAFLPGRERLCAMNGNTPGTLSDIARALTRFTPIGGQLSLSKLGGRGLSVRLAFPPEPDEADVAEKAEFIESQVQRALRGEEPPRG